MGYFWQAAGSRGQAWEGGEDALGRLSEKRRNNPSFKAVPAAPWEPLRRLWATFDSLFGASGRPLDSIFHCVSESCFGLVLGSVLKPFSVRFEIYFWSFG